MNSGLQEKMPRNRGAKHHSDDNEFLVDLEKEPEGTGTISGHAIQAKNDQYDSDEDSTPPPQPQERFLFPPSDSEDENEDADDNDRKPRAAQPAKKSAPQSRNKATAHDVNDAEDEEDPSKSKKKNKSERRTLSQRSEDDQHVSEAKKAASNSRAESKAHSRKDKPAQQGKKACRKVDPHPPKDMKPLQPIRHKTLDSVESGDWMPSPKAHGPGFELLGEEVCEPNPSYLLPPTTTLAQLLRHRAGLTLPVAAPG